jgi:hypothetical protein
MVGIGHLLCGAVQDNVCTIYYLEVDTTVLKNYVYINQAADINFQFFIFACLFMLSFLIGIYTGSND